MMTSLDALIITFLVLSGLSLLGLLVMFLGRKERVKKVGFYYTTMAAIGLTTINVLCHPPLYIAGYLLVIGFGLLAVAALVLHIRKKTPEKRKLARIMAAVSMMAAIADLSMV